MKTLFTVLFLIVATRSTAGYKAIGYFTETLTSGTDVLAEIVLL